MLISAACNDKERHPRFAIPEAGREMKAAISFDPPDWRKPIGKAGFAMQPRGSASGLVRIWIVTIDTFDAVARNP